MATEGQAAINKRTGARAVFTNGQWVSADGKAQPMEASMRSRMDLGLAPMVQSHQDMRAVEAQGNPYAFTRDPGNTVAKTLSDVELPEWMGGGNPLKGFAQWIGGQDFQDYEQAAASFESQLMPIMSGAAVTPSEASRQIRSALPALGNSSKTLGDKGFTREMMLNGAAKAKGLPLPFPNVPTYGINTLAVPQGKPQPAAQPRAGGPVRVNTPQEAMSLPPGTEFVTPDGRRKVR
jgi:hypothetical protein